LFSRIFYVPALLLIITLSQAWASEKGSIIDLSSLMKMDQLLEKIAANRIVYVSETHTEYAHHLNQLAVIKSQHERHENLAIGLEFIQQPFQSVLDDFVAGRIDEETMLKGTEYFERWSYDYRLYRPVFDFARQQRIPLVALNVDKDLIDMVKIEGIQNLKEDDRVQLPADIDRDNAAYRERLLEVYELHPHGDSDSFERFLEVQLLWDEGMADSAHRWLLNNPDGHMVILAGSGHIMYKNGIPDRLTRRNPLSSATVINITRDSPIDPDMGDYIIMTDEQALPPFGTLGVLLDTTQSTPVVSGFTPGSGAQAAGVKKDDQIIRIGDRRVNSYADIRLAILDKTVDETVEIEVIRRGLIFGSSNRNFNVTLQ
jgi:uncharacterized iron-regulated protein